VILPVPVTGLWGMEPMCSVEQSKNTLCHSDQEALLRVARASIRYGLEQGTALPVEPTAFSAPLQEQRASFVTLLKKGRLRGCIGHLEASQPVVADVAANAYSAAFEDPRFPSISSAELPLLEIHISLLTPAEPLQIGSEAELINLLQPGVDGLILEDGYHRGTFLPSVWEQLPNPGTFVTQLKLKAGLPADHWSETLRVYRYRTESFSDGDSNH